jgi:CRP/FNR family transcriptional regulator
MVSSKVIRPHGHLDVLRNVPGEYRQFILDQCTRRKFKKNEVVWRQGDPAQYVGFLVQGKVMSSYASPNGKTGVTGFWASGDILGAADIGMPGTRQMTVRCLEDSHIFTLNNARFFEFATRFPELSLAVIRALSVRLRWVAHLALALETQNAFERFCVLLLALSDTFPQEHPEGVLIDLALNHEFLAAIIGVTRQFANVTLHDLQRQGLIRLQGRRIVVLDRDRLAAIAYHSPAESTDGTPELAGR